MAIHRRIRKAARLSLQALRRGRETLKRRRARRRLARNKSASVLNERFSALAAYILKGERYETAWELFRHGHFKGLEHEEAALELAAWAKAHRITVQFDRRRVNQVEVIYLILTRVPAD